MSPQRIESSHSSRGCIVHPLITSLHLMYVRHLWFRCVLRCPFYRSRTSTSRATAAPWQMTLSEGTDGTPNANPSPCKLICTWYSSIRVISQVGAAAAVVAAAAAAAHKKRSGGFKLRTTPPLLPLDLLSMSSVGEAPATHSTECFMWYHTTVVIQHTTAVLHSTYKQ